MEHGDRLDGRAKLIAGAVALVWMGWLAWAWWIGHVPMNGDAAVYAHQAQLGDLTARWTHAAYVALLWLLGGSLRAGAVLSALSLGVGCLALGWHARREGGEPVSAMGWSAAWVLPWVAYAEVDPVWWACAALALVGSAVWGGVWLGLAVAISPTALGAIPWIVMKKQDFRWVGALVVVGLLTVLSGGEWWVGRRGLLEGGWSPAPLVHLGWLVPALVVLVTSGEKPGKGVLIGALALVPAILAPGDVPGHWLAALALAPMVSKITPRRAGVSAVVSRLALVGLLFLAGSATLRTHQRVVREAEQLTVWAFGWEVGDVARGPWSLRVRLALQVGEAPESALSGPCRTRVLDMGAGDWRLCATRPRGRPGSP